MSAPTRAADTGGKIIIDGNIRHRHSAIGFQKWRQRYVVFKITKSGRLEFVIYKEPPAIPDNEVKSVAIDEYGGLETNLRLESERYIFALITNSSTECFSVDSPQEINAWIKVLQENLGKELVLNISIPFKQNILKAGKAQLRIRNLGFTITTCENPPRVQGSWQIMHIRKYGGSEFFKFETGSRCPTGQGLYTIQTDDNKRVKTLFSELSQHKPIFTDDRVGRHMTLEKNTKPHSQPIHRISLPQPPTADPSGYPFYQNRDAIASVLPDDRKHSLTVGEDLSHPNKWGVKTMPPTGIPGTAVNIDDLGNRQYANWSAQRTPGRTSPTKKLHPQYQLPVDYYSVVPPAVIQQRTTSASNSSPPSSPETEKYIREDFMSPSRKVPEDDYSLVNSSRKPTIIGDHILFSSSDSPSPALNGAGGEMYQNLKFLHGNSANGPDIPQAAKLSEVPTDTLVTRVMTSDSDWTPHNYTNVELAKQEIKSKKSFKERKENDSFYPGGKRSPVKNPSLTLLRGLKNSRSTDELLGDPDRSSKHNPDYYNMMAPELPANSTNSQRLRATLSLTSLHRQQYNGVDEIDGVKHTSSDVPGPSLSSDAERRSKSPLVNHTYDSLSSLQSDNKEVSSELYDRLSPLPGNQNSSSSSPEPVLSPSGSLNQLSLYQRKMLIQRYHKYEHIDVDLEHSGESSSSDGVFSPANEHPHTWIPQDPEAETSAVTRDNHRANVVSKKRISVKGTKSNSRKKPLPLQLSREESPELAASSQSLIANSKIHNRRRKPSPVPRKSRVRDSSSNLAVPQRSNSSDESSFELIPSVGDNLKSELVPTIPNGTDHPKISGIQVELVKDPLSEYVQPPLAVRNSCDSKLSKQSDQETQSDLAVEIPSVPPRPQHHKVPLPPMRIDIDKKPSPPKPRVLCAPDNTKNYAALTFTESVDFDDSAYSTVNVNQPLALNRSISVQQGTDERVSYSAVNFPMMNALHSTMRERMTERANS